MVVQRCLYVCPFGHAKWGLRNGKGLARHVPKQVARSRRAMLKARPTAYERLHKKIAAMADEYQGDGRRRSFPLQWGQPALATPMHSLRSISIAIRCAVEAYMSISVSP